MFLHFEHFVNNNWSTPYILVSSWHISSLRFTPFLLLQIPVSATHSCNKVESIILLPYYCNPSFGELVSNSVLFSFLLYFLNLTKFVDTRTCNKMIAIIICGNSSFLIQANVLFLFFISIYKYSLSHALPFFGINLFVINYLTPRSKKCTLLDSERKNTRWLQITCLDSLPSMLAFSSKTVFKDDLM